MSKEIQSSSPVSSDSDLNKSKLEWQTPVLLELDFHRTEGGMGAFPEGTVAGLPVGSQS